MEELRLAIDKFLKKELLITNEQVASVSTFRIGEISNTLAISTQKGLVFTKMEDIMNLSADRSYTTIQLTNGEKHFVSKSITHFEKLLTEFPFFFRTHKSHIINLKYIRESGAEIVMEGDNVILLSRAKKERFSQFI